MYAKYPEGTKDVLLGRSLNLPLKEGGKMYTSQLGNYLVIIGNRAINYVIVMMGIYRSIIHLVRSQLLHQNEICIIKLNFDSSMMIG